MNDQVREERSTPKQTFKRTERNPAMPTTEPRYPLLLTMVQLNELKIILDAASASEGDPDAVIFSLLDQVREVRVKAANVSSLRNPGAQGQAAETLANVDSDFYLRFISEDKK
ncbi:hypothetical protein [Pseudomonas sp. RT6P73]